MTNKNFKGWAESLVKKEYSLSSFLEEIDNMSEAQLILLRKELETLTAAVEITMKNK